MTVSESLSGLDQIRARLEQILFGVFAEDNREEAPGEIPQDLPVLELGISSLALVEGMRQVYEQFGVLISIRRVIEAQVSLTGLALMIEQELSTRQFQKKTPVSAQTQSKPIQQRMVAIAPAQQHVAFLSRYSNQANAAFNETVLVRLEGALDGPALYTAIEEAVQRTEALRSALSQDSDELVITTGQSLELKTSQVSPDDLERKIAELASQPFSPGENLFRVELLRLSQDEHLLALVGHTLVIDYQALVLVLDEIAGLYQHYRQEQTPPPPSPNIQSSDFLAMVNTGIAREAFEKARSYWQTIFSGDIPKLDLPTDHTRPAIKQYSGARLVMPLEPQLETDLRAWAAAHKTPVQQIIFAAFSLLLHRLSGQRELVIGYESELLDLEAGFRAFARTRNLLALRRNLEPQSSFLQYLQSQSAMLAEAHKHRNFSLAELIQVVQTQRDQSRSALFTASFRALEHDLQPIFAGLKTEILIAPGSGARYDLDLILHNSPHGAQLVCDYSVELFEPHTIQRWLEGLQVMLKAGLENTGQPCASLPIMPESERRLLLEDWNATQKAYPRQNTVLDKILEQTQVRPFQTCIRFGDAEITYSQLLHRLEAITRELHSQGVQAGDRVGILMERSLDLIPALLAVWRTGAIYVPMDLGFPKQRLAFMLEAADVKTVITTQAFKELLPGGLNTTLIEDIPTQDQADLVEITPPSGKDSAIILFTSGSTGKPKGVELRHDALLNVLLATQDYLEFSPTSIMLALTTISFDISTNEIIMPLLGGGCVDLAEDGLAADGFGLAERIQTCQPTHVQATASTWKAVLTAGWQGDPKICLVSTGEALSRDLAEQLLTRCASLWNLYGPSETTVFSSAYRVESMPGQPIRIGRPIPNTQFYILDEFLQPVFPGAVGELFIGGEGVARGYWQKPELTEQRFLANPFRPGERMYRTGDLARYQPNGEVICLGRTDDQVKIHGVRVELGEVETALRSIPGVRDAVAAAWRDSRSDHQLVGYVICDPTTALEAADIRARLRENLPETMAPPYILFMESFPKTANGKVHRAALPAPQPAKQAPGKAALPPATPTERLLAKAWAKILEIDPLVIARETDFMEIGGHSLLITPLMLEVRQQFQVSFNLRQFFEASTLMKFSALIDQKRKLASAGTNGRKPAQPVRNAEWGRQRMAFLQREAQLPTHIAPARGAVFQAPPAIRSVFLTGATGFLGAYIVAEILQNSPVDLYCLVRPKRGEQARQRIERQMRYYQVWRDDPAWQSAWEERLHVVEGDVTLPRMGLTDLTYETLARDIDAILHGAAHVNFIYPYEALRAANVLGIHEIIRFAFHSRIKQVHHLSTAAIWPMGAQYTFYEKDIIDHGKPLNLGYDEAKWVGEKCLLNASERGLPVARYRPGEVGGDSLTGRCVTDHFLFACIKGFLQFGAFPALDIEVDVAPVDYVAQAIVHLIFHGNTLGRAFHLTNPHRRHMSAALTYLRSLGYQFEEMPFETLRDRLIASSDFANNALFAYQAALQEMDNISLQLPTYDTRQALRELAGSGIACPPADEKLFETYLRYFWESGFLPAPVEIAFQADIHA